MNKLLVILFFFVFSTPLSARWFPLSSNTESHIQSVHFTDASNGWISGFNNLIHYTSDGGNTWINTGVHGISDSRWYSIYAIDMNSTYACGCRFNYDRYQNNYAYTTNGGSSWVMQSSWGSQAGSWRKVFFVNENYGWKVGYRYGKGRIDRTTTGISGFTDELTFDNNLFSVHFIDQNNGWISGSDGFVARSIDGGATWTDLESGITEDLLSVFFINSTIGLVAGHDNDTGVIYKTIDGGVTWYQVNHPETMSMYCIQFVTDNVGWICGSRVESLEERGVILYTDDSGENWTEQYLCNTLSALYNLFFIDQLIGWAVGYDGTLLKTNNAGGTSSQGIHDDFNTITVRNYPNPFSSGITFEYHLSDPGMVEIKIFDYLGNLTDVIIEEQSVGYHRVAWKPRNLAAGLYYYCLRTRKSLGSGKIVKMNER